MDFRHISSQVTHRVLLTYFGILTVNSSLAQGDAFAGFKSWSDFYIRDPKHLFVESSGNNTNSVDTILLVFSHTDSLTIKIPGRNTVNWTNLYAVTKDGLKKIDFSEAWLAEFMTFKISDSDTTDYVLKIHGCWIDRTVYLKR